ncbi:MAG: glycosyltransferase family 4 protein [Egibacteraceae bacterium]
MSASNDRSLRPARVLHLIVPQREGAIGGADLHVLDLAVAQQRHGSWQPVILAPRAPWGYLERLRNANLAAVTAPRLRSVLRRLPPEHGISLVHAHGYEANYLLAILRQVSRRWSRLPAVVTAHGWIETTPWLRMKSALDRMSARTADVRIASAYAHASRLGVDHASLLVIHNGVPEQASDRLAHLRGERVTLRTLLGIPPEAFLVGAVGRLSPEKRIDLLLIATGRIAAKRPELRLIVVGGGAQRAALEKLATRLGIREQVTFTGLVTDTAPVYVALDLLIQPSDTEGTPRTILEAMAHRVPVIATDVGDVAEVLDHGRAGILTSPNDAGALADAMVHALDHPARARERSERAYLRYRRHFTIETMRRRVDEGYALAVREAMHRHVGR